MIRQIKRYGGGSRKLYDTEESRYVSLDEIAGWVRGGQQVQVVDSATGEDVTAPTLAQVIYEGEKRGISHLPADLFHDVIRRSEQARQAVSERVERLQQGVEGLMRKSVDRLGPVRDARDEMESLRQGLQELERSLAELERAEGRPARKKAKRARTARK